MESPTSFPPASLHHQMWSRVLDGVMQAFDEVRHDEPSGEARFIAEYVIDELDELLPKIARHLAASTPTRQEGNRPGGDGTGLALARPAPETGQSTVEDHGEQR